MVKSSFKVLAAAAVVCAVGQTGFAQVQGPSTLQTPYVLPTGAGVITKSIISNGNGVGTALDETHPKAGGGTYRLVGIPDGLGAFDNGDGTFTLLVNHELTPTAGATRGHGSTGAFVSKWIINKSDLSVVNGQDLITSVKTWDATAEAYVTGTTQFNRLCSADLPEQTAFFNAASGLGTTEKLFMNGEETGNAGSSTPYGRAWATQVTGAAAGTSWELPELGRIPWENSVASPFAQDKTIVMGLDDGGRVFSSEGGGDPSQFYVYVGNKTNSGSSVERAGLTNGNLFGVKVTGRENEDQIVNGDSFSLFDYSTDVSDDTTGFALEAESIANDVTEFRRIEDGAWDPNNENVFYFVTTDTTTPSGGRSQLWQLTFNDITNPEAGGTIDALTTGLEGYEMLDNMTAVDVNGVTKLVLQEDVGNNSRLGRQWLYNTATDNLLEVTTFDSARFGDGPTNGALTTPVTAPFNRDEEASGVIPAPFLGKGWFLGTVQAHYSSTAELVQGGQVFAMYIPQAAVPEPGTLALLGTGIAGLALIARRRRKA